MFYSPEKIEVGEDFTRVIMKRDVSGVISSLFEDFPHRWCYGDCLYWVGIFFEGWSFSRAEHYAYSLDEKQWIKVPGVVLHRVKKFGPSKGFPQ